MLVRSLQIRQHFLKFGFQLQFLLSQVAFAVLQQFVATTYYCECDEQGGKRNDQEDC